MVEIELYGVPRLRAGVGRVTVEGTSLAEAMAALGRAVPSLAGTVLDADGRVHPAYRLCLNGDRFVSDPDLPLADRDVLLLLSADVGG